MSVKETIKRLVNDVAQDCNIKDYKAFGLWFLQEMEEMSPEAAEDALVDGPWDNGRDAVDFDTEEKVLTIYQFKYSDNLYEIKKAFTDLQRGLQSEVQHAIEVKAVRLIIVSLASENEEILNLLRSNEDIVSHWLRTVGSEAELVIEHFDLSKFTQIFEKLTGVTAQIDFREPPLESGIGQIGIIDARAFITHIDKDELLAFNIRKFLGVRKNNVNWKILETLKKSTERDRFWLLNNGLVCVYTKSSVIDTKKKEYSNLSIVNGAQTVNTISKFITDNPAASNHAIWVVAKFVEVSEYDRDFALRLTVTSNTQNAVSYKDLRASEQSHEILQNWLSALGLVYQYKRGDASKGKTIVPMKDLAQAYVAFCGQPNVAFARAGSIFGEMSELYSNIFPERDILELNAKGDATKKLNFLGPRLVALELLNEIRHQIAEEIKKDPQVKQWRSASYHLVWMFASIINESEITDYYHQILPKVPLIVKAGFESLFSGIQEFARDRALLIPKSLKSNEFTDNISSQDWLTGSYFANKARKAVSGILK